MTDTLSTVRAYIDRIAAGDVEGALALAHDDALFQGPDGSQMDKSGLRALFAHIRPLMPNPLEMDIVGTTSEGHRIAVEARARTVLANGKVYANLYHFLYEVRDGKIAAVREYCDTTRASLFAEP